MQASLIGKTRALYLSLAVVLLLGTSAAGAYAGKDEKSESKGYLGVYMQKLTKDIRKGLDIDVKRGVLISGVEEGSPAEEAGIEDGDVIVEFDGKAVRSPDDFRDLVAATAVGEKVKVKVIRDGDDKTIDVVVGERPEKFAWTVWDDDDVLHFKDNVFGMVSRLMPGQRLGVKAAELNDDLASYFDTGKDGGVLVLEVEEESIAEEAGIKPGDVIREIDGEKIASIDELKHSLGEYDEGDEFEITVIRHGKKQTMSATMDEQKHVKYIRRGMPRFDKYGAPHIEIDEFRDSPRVKKYEDKLRKEMDELKKELKKLKKEIEELKKD
jgi:C-terminal processing protease CtpA/Prc